jgi:glutaredoxin 2
MKRENGLARIMIRKYLAQAGMPEFSSKPIAKFDGSIMGSALTKIKETYQSHFEKQLNSPLLYNEIQLQILNSDPYLLSNSKLYQDLALLVLNQYLVK